MSKSSSQPPDSSGEYSTLAPGEVEAQLARILSARGFAGSGRLKGFLGYVVKQHLLGDDDSLKEYTIAVEVFKRTPDFDTRADPIVRVTGNRLRSKLDEYYATEGNNDEILISLPVGHYVPTIKRRPANDEPVPQPQLSRVRWRIALAAVVMALISGILTTALRSHMIRPRLVPPVAPGRILARATSEGANLKRIPLMHRPHHLALSSNGKKLFAAEVWGRTLSIIDTDSATVRRTLRLPSDMGALAGSPSGLLFIGSMIDGLFVVDMATEQLLPGVIPTGGPVIDMAVTPDGQKLFLAMSNAGLKRFSTGNHKLSTVSDRVCPEHVAVDSSGKKLYVAYQCSGPLGRSGHDSIEIFDVEKEISLGIVTGPPMVGGALTTSPDGKLVVADGSDACWRSDLDHKGCLKFPSHVYYLIRASDQRVLHQFTLPVRPGNDGYIDGYTTPHFVDDSRFLILGDSVVVEDAIRYSVLERSELPSGLAQTVVFSPDGRRAWLADPDSSSISVLELDGADCSAPRQGLSISFPADGTNEDSVSGAVLSPSGKLRFAPGRVGQAFLLDGTNSLSTSSAGYFQDGAREMSLALYLKFADIDGETALIDWIGENPRRGFRLLKGGDNRLLFQSWPGGATLQSKTAVTRGAWYHLAVTRTDREIVMYVNGEPEARGSSPPYFTRYVGHPLSFGAGASGRRSFRGLMDEILGYNRALTDREVKTLYQLRESGSCKL